MPESKDVHRRMVEAVEAYIAGFNNKDLDAIVALFAPDASVEDPVGTPPRRGREALREFFGQALASGARLDRDGAVRLAANCAAFPFHVTLDLNGQPTRIDVIDVFRFDEEGRIAQMQAYFGPENIKPVAGD